MSAFVRWKKIPIQPTPLRSFRLRWQRHAIFHSPADVASFFLALFSFVVACGAATTLALGLSFVVKGRPSFADAIGPIGLIVALTLTLAALGWIVRSLVVIHLRLCGDLQPSRPLKSIEKRPSALWDREVDGGI